MHIANDPEPAPTPRHMWRVLREYICAIWTLIDSPLALARRVWIHRDEARGISESLRPLEMMLRRLIFLDALEFELAAAPIPAPRAYRPRILAHSDRDPAPLNLDSAETWRVSFDLRMRGRYGPPASRRRMLETEACMLAGIPAVHIDRAPLPNADFTAPLARRAEALLRGFNDPAPLVQRMARLLARDRWRQYRILAGVRLCDRAKPFFHEAAQTIALAQDAFQAWLKRQLDKPKSDSS